MWTENNVFLEDSESITQTPCIPWENLQGKTVLVTGGTGLIGSTLINSLLYASKKMSLDLQVLALIRNQDKAEKMFYRQLQERLPLHFIIGTVCLLNGLFIKFQNCFSIIELNHLPVINNLINNKYWLKRLILQFKINIETYIINFLASI